ncbi:RluA family pseudouridine synthase [Oceanobacillus alkalisoli]|uniref:RluA family pseudouridine synthase n=1 Tax=Oceanobacillus alkalisoli TaxID=2925113 RepID=UPI001F119ABA|nr:RluA family pseudouridine synthase [Oceanobacillus alkalisoli]MCF3943368.1 RluA family pseudouridine synthase [Oceanobacillus alkalisoli]
MPKKKSNYRKDANSIIVRVKEPDELLSFLFKAMPTRSRNSVKSILGRGQVMIDDAIEKQFNYKLKPGQTVTILKNKAAIKQDALIGVQILYEDDDILVINKEAGLLSIATEKEKRHTALHQLMKYVKRENPDNRIFIVHRLDKDTSGIMLFAKSNDVKRKLQDNWKTMVKERTYAALVEGKVSKKEGYITSWLRETKTHIMYSSQTPNDGLLAKTRYKFIQGNADFSLLEVNLETGRKNQIRVHMQDLGHPVVGDKKYGSKERNAIGRLGLHAKVLAFHHPATNKLMTFKADVPASFIKKSK